MKQKLFLFLAGLALILQACEKTEYVKASPQLEITVMGNNVVLIEGATVTLFNTKEDWSHNENPVQSLQTDSKGQVLFENLNEQKYYFFVGKDDMNNFADISATSEPLKTGQLSQLLVKIMENPL